MSDVVLTFTVPAGSSPVFTGPDGALLDVPGSELLHRTIGLAA